MDYRRVAELYDPYRKSGGTGYLIRDNLILTAHHVIAPMGENGKLGSHYHFRFIGDYEQKRTEWVMNGCYLCWDTHHKDFDLALLMIEGDKPKFLSAHNSTTRFGRLGGKTLSAEGIGFPVVQEIENRDNPEPVKGELSRIAALKEKQLRLEVTSLIPKYPNEWQGISGTALFVRDVLVGVIVETNKSFAEKALWATPISLILEESPEFCRLLFDNSDVSLVDVEKLISIEVSAIEEPDKLRIDLKEAESISNFYGRKQELIDLNKLILDNRCRLVYVLGMGGIGKSCLVRNCVENITLQENCEFKFIIWKSLKNNPPLSVILQELIEFLSNQHQTVLPDNIDASLSLLIKFLAKYRCLLILDDFNSLFKDGSKSGIYVQGRDNYKKLLEEVGKRDHNSCLVLTSRESPSGSAPTRVPNVKAFEIQGLSTDGAKDFWNSRCSLNISEDDLNEIVNHYAGNPLALGIVIGEIEHSLRIQGNIPKFLQLLRKGDLPFEMHQDLDDLLKRELDRISEEAREVMYWIAILRQPISCEYLEQRLLSPNNILSELTYLDNRFLLLKTMTEKVTQQPVVMAYVTKRFINELCKEIQECNINLLDRYSLIEATTIDYVRESQISLILNKLKYQCLDYYKNESEFESQLLKVIDHARKIGAFGYAVGNVLNLLVRLDSWSEKNANSKDFSNLTIRQAYLQNKNLYHINFSQSTFIECAFSELFSSVFSVAFSSNDKFIAAGDMNGTLHIYNIEKNNKVSDNNSNCGWVWALAFSPNSEVLASGTADSIIRLWDIETGESLQELEGHLGIIRSLAFSANSKILASGSNDNSVRLWDIETGECISILEEHTNAIWAVAFHVKDNSIFASAGVDKTVRLWTKDSSNMWHAKILFEHTKSVCSLAFSPDENWLASSSHDKTIILWNLHENRIERTFSGEQGHKDWVWTISFSSDSKFLASGGEEQSIKIWDIENGICVDTFVEHNHAVRGIAYSPKEGSNKLVSGSYDQTVKLLEWDIDKQKMQCLKTWKGLTSQIRSVAFNHDSTMLASCGGDSFVRLWKINFDTSGYQETKIEGHKSWVWAVTFSPDGKILASSGDDGIVKLWNVQGEKFELLQELLPNRWTKNNISEFNPSTSRVRCIVFNDNGKFLACGCNDNKLRIWKQNNNEWTLHKTLPNKIQEDRNFGHTNWIWSVEFASNAPILASASEDKTIKLWNINTGQLIRTLEGHDQMVYCIAFSPNGKMLASGSGDKTIRLWDVQSGDCLETLNAHNGWIWSIAFSNDSKTLASGSADNHIKFWNVSETSKLTLIRTLEKHTNSVRCVRFSADGNYLASGGDDQTIFLWDVQTGNHLVDLKAQKPYQGMNISKTQGLSDAQKKTLKVLGAIDDNL